jgi:hypothetical protein
MEGVGTVAMWPKVKQLTAKAAYHFKMLVSYALHLSDFCHVF